VNLRRFAYHSLIPVVDDVVRVFHIKLETGITEVAGSTAVWTFDKRFSRTIRRGSVCKSKPRGVRIPRQNPIGAERTSASFLDGIESIAVAFIDADKKGA
jgi:hypothetical protein